MTPNLSARFISDSGPIKSRVSYFGDFLHKFQLVDPDCQKIYLGMSGGPDSTALFYLSYLLHKRGELPPIEILHVNYGWREGHKLEAQEIIRLSKRFDIPLHQHRVKTPPPTSNYEEVAREIRLNFFKRYLKQNHLLFLGHHIDDSFEWSLLQSLRSSNSKGLFGIPVKNGKLRRPLHCFTKDHLKDFCRLLGVVPYDDPTNQNIHFERNFLRQNIIPLLKERHPRLLKHFVYSRMELLESRDSKAFSPPKLDHYLIKNSFKGPLPRKKILHLLFLLSGKKRGSYQSQLDRLEQARKNQRWGALSFSGGVKVYLSPYILLLASENYLSQLQKKDNAWAHNLSQARKGLRENFPYIKVLHSENRGSTKAYKKPYPLWSSSLGEIQKQGLKWIFLDPFNQNTTKGEHIFEL